MIPQSPGYIFASIGGLTLTWYGVCIVAGLLAGFAILWLKTKHNTKLQEDVFDIAFWTLLAGFVGARVYHIWNEWWWYQNHLGDIYKIWEGGLAIHGGLIAGALVIFFLARRKKISFLRLLDFFAPAVLAGQIFGRFGNYFNEELFGKPLDAWWALQVSPASRPAQFVVSSSFHPIFLYEILLNGLLLTTLLVIWKRKSARVGVITGVYIIGYGIIRFSLDFLRFDQFGFGILTLAQWVSLCLVVIGGFLIYRAYKRQPANQPLA